VTKRSIASFSLLVAATGMLAACGGQAPPNIIVIVGDTLRADRLGSYGNARGLTPFIDSIAERGVVFRNAYAPSSWTNPSVASLFTSRYPSQHGVIAFDSVLPGDEITLAEELREAGYATGFFSPNGLLREDWGFAQGFTEFSEFAIPPRPNQPDYLWIPYRADYTNRHVVSWLDSLASKGEPRPPVFLYIQYMEPHSPYAPPEAALQRMLDGRPKPDLAEVNLFAFVGNDAPIEDRMVRDLQDVYDAEVLSLDTQLRRLFSALGSRGLLENAIVVVTSDHGEEFAEHGLIGHEKTLYGEVIRIPLVISPPGSSRRTDVEEAVSLIDLAPTLLAMVGRAAPAAFEGRSLLPLPTGGGKPAQRAVYSELPVPEGAVPNRFSPHLRSVIAGRHKLIAGRNGEAEFYDLQADPGERDPDALGEEERAALRRILEEMAEGAARRDARREVKPIDDATREQIRALGYDR
jgi:arylsulfatase A-like enzyme